MTSTKQRLLSLLAASSLASFASACGGSEPQPEGEEQIAEADTTSGGEEEQTCGAGACGSVGSQAPSSGPDERDAY